MNAIEEAQLNKYIESFEESKNIYLRVMNKDLDNDAALLMRWIVNNNINPYGVFPDYMAGAMGSLEGFDGLYCQLHHALYDDGDVSFVKIIYSTQWEPGGLITTHTLSPRVVFFWKGETNLVERVKEVVYLPRENDVVDFNVEVMQYVQEYIEEYEKVEKERRKLDEETTRMIEEWSGQS